VFSNLAVYNLNIFRSLLVVPTFFLYRYLFALSKPWHLSWSNSEILNWCIAFAIADFVFYWFHVLSHRWNLLWGAHLVHHQPEEYNLSIGGRDSIFGRSILFLMGLPVALLGVPPITYFTAAFFGIAYMGVWTHTRLIGKLGILEYFLSTPYHHKIHHYKDVARLGGSKNFGGVFIIWDRIFGTFWEEEANQDYEYGVSRVPVTYSPFESQIFFYRHLFAQFFKIPVKDRFKLLFSHYLLEPVPVPPTESRPLTYDYSDWLFCFLLLVLTYYCTSVLTPALIFGFADAAVDLNFSIKLIVAGGATCLGLGELSRILEGKGLRSRIWVTLFLTATAVALTFAFPLNQIDGVHKKGIVDFVLRSRVFLTLGSLIALG
jgi:sterol desaturase/sphingolipid hydroxylase (fatty acid hydroxylase superfamily)